MNPAQPDPQQGVERPARRALESDADALADQDRVAHRQALVVVGAREPVAVAVVVDGKLGVELVFETASA